MNVTVIGVGYIGLSILTLLSSKTKNRKYLFNVTGLEANNAKGKFISNYINSGSIPLKIDDKKFQSTFLKTFKKKRIKISVDDDIISSSDVVIVCINCDYDFQKRRVKTHTFFDSIKQIAKKIRKNTCIIIQTTLPPGTTENKIFKIIEKEFIKRKLNTSDFYLSHMFERVMPGDTYFQSSLDLDRVYGSINKISALKTKNFLTKIFKKEKIFCLNSPTESEFCKVFENSYRAVNISLLNEWNKLAFDLKLDLNKIIKQIKKRPTHSNLMKPGINVGGYCLTKDPLFANSVSITPNRFPLSSNAIKINQNLTNELFKYFNLSKIIKSPVLLLGITYKGEVDDVRWTPAISVLKNLNKLNIRKINFYDPYVNKWSYLKDGSILLKNIKNYKTIIVCSPHKKFTNFHKYFSREQNILDLCYAFSDNEIINIKRKCKKSFFIGNYT